MATPRNPNWKTKWGGALLLLVGIPGLILPIVPGIFFILIGVALLAGKQDKLRKTWDRIRSIIRLPVSKLV